MLIERKKSLLLVVDVQEKLAPAIFEGEAAIKNNVRLLTGARQLGIPSNMSAALAQASVKSAMQQP